MAGKPKPPKPHYHGHRARLWQRLLEGGADPMPDYELLEFLLFSAHARGDTKPLAKRLIKRFGTLAGVLGVSRAALEAVPGMGEAAAAQLLAVRAAASRFLRAETSTRLMIASWQKLLDYCTAAGGFAEAEAACHAVLSERPSMLLAAHNPCQLRPEPRWPKNGQA
jgi:DNA repair protein RadC